MPEEPARLRGDRPALAGSSESGRGVGRGLQEPGDDPEDDGPREETGYGEAARPPELPRARVLKLRSACKSAFVRDAT